MRATNQFLFIMQGAPGSGKSTIAQALWTGLGVMDNIVRLYATDEYFCRGPGGKYEWIKEEVGQAHVWNQERTRMALERGETVIVDNTNIHAWEARPYVEMAIDLSIPIVFLPCNGTWPNSHGVPDQYVQKMRREVECLDIDSCLAAVYPWEKENPW